MTQLLVTLELWTEWLDRGEPLDIIYLDFKKAWGHMDHSDEHCFCQSSDRTAAPYVHELALMLRDLGAPSFL